ncbi:MAG: TatD family hydrolase [Lachnospiraceae bacterium]|nr:TatD family hydrolase [Lachnospiraceae bacterium]
MIFDTHAHYDDERFDEDRERLLGSMEELGVSHIVNIGASIEGCRDTAALVKKYPGRVFGAVGIHPEYAGSLNEETAEEVRALSREEGIVAIGEIGLDYAEEFAEPEERERNHRLQREWFERFLLLAREERKPVMIHSRDAADDTLRLIRRHTETARREGSFRGGVIHCFSYSPELAEEYVRLGYHLGIGGVLTFKNAKRLPEVVERIPLSRLVLETDCPYLAPVPFRGKRNESSYLRYVAERLAEIKGISIDEVEAATEANAWRLIHGVLE